MAMKELAMRLQPLPLYFILSLTVCLFFLELVIAHVTHSLTLLLDAYHALCNIIVLVGSIISIKHGSGRSDSRVSAGASSHEELKSLKSLSHQPQLCSTTKPGPERQLRNTFGWARVDVIVMLIGCVFLASLCFSVLVEALQTLAHISHHDEMHAPIPILIVGILAMVLNLLAFLLIGGYTFHQSSFLIRGNETATKGSTEEDMKKQAVAKKTEKRQGMWGLSRDCVGCVVVIICAIAVHNSSSDVAKFVDPLFSILSATLVLLLSYPFMKESCLILLQTIPDHINIGSLCSQLVSAFPDIVNVHELHVWRLTVDKTYCTAHIIFLNPKEYTRITNDISRFFLDQGITHVTIQPEFYKDLNKADLLSSNSDCLVQCNEDLCMDRHCCASRTPSLESVHVDSHCHAHKHKGQTKVKSSKCSKHCGTQVGGVAQVSGSCNHQLGHLEETCGPNMNHGKATRDTSQGLVEVIQVATAGGPKLEQEEKTCCPTLGRVEATFGPQLVQDPPVETEPKCDALVRDNTTNTEDGVNPQCRMCDVGVSQEN
uniref:Cation efflux protein cytoplasmic domain-containing protein n=1 Tax=Cuerna arida TaxID=1464854 RepID=A0A1B6FTW7_9HEMI